MMPDIKKVIKCLELCRKLTDSCEGCPYENVPPVENCMLTMHDDALNLLKEQRQQIIMLVGAQHGIADLMKNPERLEVKPQFDETYGVYGGTCPTCGNWIQSAHSFCGSCGQPIAWKK